MTLPQMGSLKPYEVSEKSYGSEFLNNFFSPSSVDSRAGSGTFEAASHTTPQEDGSA